MTKLNILEFTWQIILNPNAMSHKSGKFWRNIEQKLQLKNINYDYHLTETVEDSHKLIFDLCQKKYRHFIIVGGDGTMNNFVNGVMKSNIDTREVFATLIPLGTGNDWARTHNYSRNYLDTIDSFLQGNFVAHDVGKLERFDADKILETRYFVNIAGFGFDGEVIKNSQDKKTKIIPQAFYLINLLTTLISFKSKLIEIKSTVYNVKKEIYTMAVGIGKFNGNGMKQCPEAIVDDGLFDVVIIDKVSALKVIRNVNRLFSGAHVYKMKEVISFRTNALEINSNEIVFAEVEGELLQPANYKLECIHQAINFQSLIS